jgi:hypothetical protein
MLPNERARKNHDRDHLTRAGLDLPTRELLTFSVLASPADSGRGRPVLPSRIDRERHRPA